MVLITTIADPEVTRSREDLSEPSLHWRAIRIAGSQLAVAINEHQPHPLRA